MFTTDSALAAEGTPFHRLPTFAATCLAPAVLLSCPVQNFSAASKLQSGPLSLYPHRPTKDVVPHTRAMAAMIPREPANHPKKFSLRAKPPLRGAAQHR